MPSVYKLSAKKTVVASDAIVRWDYRPNPKFLVFRPLWTVYLQLMKFVMNYIAACVVL